MIKPLLIVGTSRDGSHELPTVLELNKKSIVATNKYLADRTAVQAYLQYTNSGNVITLNNIDPYRDIEFFDLNQNPIFLNNYSISGNQLTLHASIEVPTSGWVVYSKTTPTSDLTFAIDQVFAQINTTPIRYDTIELIRVVGESSTKASLTFPGISFEYLYKGEVGNNTKIQISSSGLTITPPAYTNYSAQFYAVDTVDKIQKKIFEDNISGLCGVRLTSSSVTGLLALCPTGTYYLTGGTYVEPTAEDYYTSLYKLNPGNYDIITFPGKYGREIFPYASYLVEEFTEFPTLYVCGSSGTTYSDIEPDIWKSDRFILLHGKVIPNVASPKLTDSTVLFSTIQLTEKAKYSYGIGTEIASSIPDNYVEDFTNKEVSLISVLKNKPVFSTVKTTKPSASSKKGIRELIRMLIEKLEPIVGQQQEMALVNAKKTVESVINFVINDGCPITDWVFQIKYNQNELVVELETTLSGSIERFVNRIMVKK